MCIRGAGHDRIKNISRPIQFVQSDGSAAQQAVGIEGKWNLTANGCRLDDTDVKHLIGVYNIMKMHDVCGRLQPDWRSHRPSQPSRAVSPCLTTRSSVLASIERLDESVRVCIYTCRPHRIKDRTLNDAKECRQP